MLRNTGKVSPFLPEVSPFLPLFGRISAEMAGFLTDFEDKIRPVLCRILGGDAPNFAI